MAARIGHPILRPALVPCDAARHDGGMSETALTAERETTAAARRRVEAADRARRWREQQREAEAARQAQLDALRAEVESLRADRDRLSAAARVDDEVLRAVARLARCRVQPDGRVTVHRIEISARDLLNVSAFLLVGTRGEDEPGGQAAFDEARRRVMDRLGRFALPAEDEATGGPHRLGGARQDLQEAGQPSSEAQHRTSVIRTRDPFQTFRLLAWNVCFTARSGNGMDNSQAPPSNDAPPA